jgi:hypothetical protein
MKKLTLVLALTVGLFAGSVLTYCLLPMSVSAQSNQLTDVAGPIVVSTALGVKLVEFYPNEGRIKLSKGEWKFTAKQTDKTVTIELIGQEISK